MGLFEELGVAAEEEHRRKRAKTIKGFARKHTYLSILGAYAGSKASAGASAGAGYAKRKIASGASKAYWAAKVKWDTRKSIHK